METMNGLCSLTTKRDEEGPSTSLTFLEILLDSTTMQASITLEKSENSRADRYVPSGSHRETCLYLQSYSPEPNLPAEIDRLQHHHDTPLPPHHPQCRGLSRPHLVALPLLARCESPPPITLVPTNQLAVLGDVVDGVNVSLQDIAHSIISFQSTSSLFSEVLKLLQLMYVLPASTATAERSFSSLRRLKNYLRNSMTPQRLNHDASLRAQRWYRLSLVMKDERTLGIIQL